MKKKTIIIAASAAVVAVVAITGFTFATVGGQGAKQDVNTIALEKTELINTVNVKGVVESANSSDVYSVTGGIIKTVDVKVGDKVTEGQILCKLKTDDLELNISQQRAELASNAETTEENLKAAQIEMETKKKSYENIKILFDAGAVSRSEFEQFETAYTLAQNKYISISETSNNDGKAIGIQRLEKQLADATITSPINGTVTAVYAEEAASSAGLLFIVEDTDNLIITANIKEYDLGNIHSGMLVDIKSDATGNDVYRGEITSIAPTSNKNTGGISSAASDVEFTAEVKITSVETNLKIGMNARLSIILDKKENVYSVPVDAVSTNQNGENVIYAVESAGKERYSARQIRVTTGMETDFYLEISGDDLSDGLQIILDSSEITSGQEITLQ